MRGVSKGLLGGVAVVWVLVMTVGVFAQTAAPAGPAEVPAEAKKMKAAFPSSPAAIESGKVLFGIANPTCEQRAKRVHIAGRRRNFDALIKGGDVGRQCTATRAALARGVAALAA